MPGKSKKGGGLEVGSAYKMKYQGNHSAFPFKSPLKHPHRFTGIKPDHTHEGKVESKGEMESEEIGTSTPTSEYAVETGPPPEEKSPLTPDQLAELKRKAASRIKLSGKKKKKTKNIGEELRKKYGHL